MFQDAQTTSMQPRDLFAIWAPSNAVWSQWAKPVIFAQLTPNYPVTPVSNDAHILDTSWCPAPTEHTAIIVNLEGPASVFMGLALALRGYRPVPLYNSCDGPGAVVPLKEIVSELVSGASLLQQQNLDPAAPPAFLLDANRMAALAPQPGQFDNRWVVFPQDFPSAVFLRSQQIEKVLLLQRNRTSADVDLTMVMRPWKQAGLELLVKDPFTTGSTVAASPAEPTPLDMGGPSRLWMWSRLFFLSSLGLRRSNAGGFGSVVPMPSSSGG